VLEIPAGKLDAPDENPASAALRELREETGADCTTLTYLGPLYTTPALIDEVIHMYMATGLTFGETDFDEDEFIEIVRIPLDQLVDDICKGLVPDAKTQAAVLRAAYAVKERA
jgi:ADP-ribose pyrophosphatase